MNQLRIGDRWEVLLAAILLRWEQNAPPDHHWGELDGVRSCNSQEARLAHVLQKVAVGQVDNIYSSLARHTRRRDGDSYISKNASRMITPMPLWEGWYVEGCQNKEHKLGLLDNLTKLGYSPEFIECARAFVEGRCIECYLPTLDELKSMFKGVPGCTFTSSREAI